jgi:hypothetical protein
MRQCRSTRVELAGAKSAGELSDSKFGISGMGFQEQRGQMVIETNQGLVEPAQATHGLPFRILIPLHDYTEVS